MLSNIPPRRRHNRSKRHRRRLRLRLPLRFLRHGASQQGAVRRKNSILESSAQYLTTIETALYAFKQEAALAVDLLTWQGYQTDPDRAIEDMHARAQQGAPLWSYHSGLGPVTVPPQNAGINADEAAKRPRRPAPFEYTPAAQLRLTDRERAPSMSSTDHIICAYCDLI